MRVIKKDGLDVLEVVVVELVKGECQFIPSHLLAVVKTGQFSKFLHFQEDL